MFLLAAFSMSCSKDMPEPAVTPDAGSGEGAATIAFNLPAGAVTRAEGDYNPLDYFDIRFYQYKDGEKKLIRHYFDADEMPESIWLLEGKYCVTVSLGDRESGLDATFDKPIYFGSQDFDIVAGETTQVEVNCRIQNTVVEVVFDKSIVEKFDRKDNDDNNFGLDFKYKATVAIMDGWDSAKALNGEVPLLHYMDVDMKTREDGSQSRSGYFVLPAGADAISYCFWGHSYDNELVGYDPDEGKRLTGATHAHRSKKLNLPPGADSYEGVKYTLTFKYSENAEGYISVDFEISIANVDVCEDVKPVNPSPKPTIEVPDWDMSKVYQVENQTMKYNVSYKESTLTGAKLYIDNDIHNAIEIDFAANPATRAGNPDGITADVKDDGHSVELTLGPAFLNKLSGGEHKLEFTISADNGQEGDVTSKIKTQGLVSVEHRAWRGAALAKTVIFDSSKSKIQYCEKGSGQWKDYTPATLADDNIYYVPGVGFDNRGKTFEYRLTVDGQQAGPVMEIETETGAPQMPNAGFETWTGSSPLYPYGDGVEQWWDTGNHGSATLKKNVTTNETNNPHSGETCAKLQSQFVALGIIGKFAAGNIFVGVYAGTNGTNGSIGFGKPFGYTYKPKAIRFWYRGTVGNIDEKDSKAPSYINKGDSDVAQFYCIVCKTEGPHIVDTRDDGTFMNFESKTISYCSGAINKDSTNDKEDGLVIGVGTWDKTQTQITKTNGEGGHATEDTTATIDGWTMMEVPINYNSDYDDEKPTYIMVTASASKYGDYFSGSTNSVMYIDDVELVY